MIIEQADRVDMLVFTLPFRAAIFDMPGRQLTPTAKAEWIGVTFDEYVAKVAGELAGRIGFPIELSQDEWQATVGIMPRDGWEIWQARYARLVINKGEEAG